MCQAYAIQAHEDHIIHFFYERVETHDNIDL